MFDDELDKRLCQELEIEYHELYSIDDTELHELRSNLLFKLLAN